MSGMDVVSLFNMMQNTNAANTKRDDTWRRVYLKMYNSET